MRGPRGGVAQRSTRTQSTAATGDFPRPTPSPAQPLYDYSSTIGTGGRRDSDASSLCSSLPSSVGGRSTYSVASASSDRASYLRAVNSYLSSLSPPIFLKPPLPPSKDVIDALHRLFSHLDRDAPVHDLTRDLPCLLAALGCPIKLSKSALKAPSTPHAWPVVISVLYWLVQLARVADHLVSSPSAPQLSKNALHRYMSGAYSFFLAGDDCAVVDLDAEYLDRAERDVASAVKNTEALEAEVAQLEEKHRDLTAAPSRLEALEVERAALLEDVKKFQSVVEKFSGIIEEKKEKLAERDKELETRGLERRRLDEENGALKQRIQGQALSTRDVERMMRELQAVEREISDAERRRNEADEKTWLLNPEVEREFREIETSTEQCNQAIKKLKIGNYFQHVPNPEASSATEVIGIEYKTMLKPAIGAVSEEARKSKVLKVEELINTQKQSLENDMILDGKKAHCTNIQTLLNEIEAQNDLLKKEIEEHASIYSSEAATMQKDLASKQQEVDALERNAQDLLMDSEEILKRTTVEGEEETQFCAQELCTLIDSVSKCIEFMGTTISGIRDEMDEMIRGVKLAFEASIRYD